MPIYAFECSTCGNRFDRLQKLSDPDPEICPECGKPTVKRRVTAPSFRLAGSGWYETDFKKDGDKKRNLAESAKGESKPESSSASTRIETGETKKADAKPAENEGKDQAGGRNRRSNYFFFVSARTAVTSISMNQPGTASPATLNAERAGRFG